MILLSGFSCGQIVHAVPFLPLKVVSAIPLLAAASHLALLADRATNNFVDPRRAHLYFGSNPYVYAHTSPMFLKLVDRVHELMPFTAPGDQSQINVVVTDYCPPP